MNGRTAEVATINNSSVDLSASDLRTRGGAPAHPRHVHDQLMPVLTFAGGRRESTRLYEVRGKQNHLLQIEDDCNPGLVVQELPSVRDHQHDENRLARSSDNQCQGSDVRLARWVNQQLSHQLNQCSQLRTTISATGPSRLAPNVPRSAASGAMVAYTIVNVSTPETIINRWMLRDDPGHRASSCGEGLLTSGRRNIPSTHRADPGAAESLRSHVPPGNVGSKRLPLAKSASPAGVVISLKRGCGVAASENGSLPRAG